MSGDEGEAKDEKAEPPKEAIKNDARLRLGAQFRLFPSISFHGIDLPN